MRREQIRHLRQCMELPFLGLQIMPMKLPKHAGLAGPMVLLETPITTISPTSRAS
ncbi:Scr1 family TA system antitoxin-like transcriptional regulator [Streptomyces sp. M10(2022)]